jgi:hypothetical protein
MKVVVRSSADNCFKNCGAVILNDVGLSSSGYEMSVVEVKQCSIRSKKGSSVNGRVRGPWEVVFEMYVWLVYKRAERLLVNNCFVCVGRTVCKKDLMGDIGAVNVRGNKEKKSFWNEEVVLFVFWSSLMVDEGGKEMSVRRHVNQVESNIYS